MVQVLVAYDDPNAEEARYLTIAIRSEELTARSTHERALNLVMSPPKLTNEALSAGVIVALGELNYVLHTRGSIYQGYGAVRPPRLLVVGGRDDVLRRGISPGSNIEVFEPTEDWRFGEGAEWRKFIDRLRDLTRPEAVEPPFFGGRIDLREGKAVRSLCSRVLRAFRSKTGLEVKDGILRQLTAPREKYLERPEVAFEVESSAFAGAIWDVLRRSFRGGRRIRAKDVVVALADHRKCPLLWFC